MNHVVMFSGGIGSWATAKRVAERHGIDNLVLLFADTLTEDEDLYRFLVEGAGQIAGINVVDLADRARSLPKLEEDDRAEERKALLLALKDDANLRIPYLRWIAEGRDIWQVFEDVRFLGNTRIDPCSRVLKREICRAWLQKHCQPEDTTVYIGYDWTEMHRVERAAPFWAPWRVEAPMCDAPYLAKDEMFAELKQHNIELPLLYRLKASHNNCGGGCVKAGIAHFKHLLKVYPERYLWWERKERQMREFLEKPVAILRDRTSAAKCVVCKGAGAVNSQGQLCGECDGTGRATRPLTLREVRENTSLQADLFDWGDCNCFLGDESDDQTGGSV